MNIKQRIADAGLTVSDVAQRMPRPDGGVGISQPSMSSLINGNPTVSKLKDIAGILGISLSELVSEPTPKWQPAEGETYHYISVPGGVNFARAEVVTAVRNSETVMTPGNVFRSEVEAKAVRMVLRRIFKP